MLGTNDKWPALNGVEEQMNKLIEKIPQKLLGKIPYTKSWSVRQKLLIQPELTNNCNFRCVYCPHSIYRKKVDGSNQFNREKGYMSEELWDIVLRNAAKYVGIIMIGFFGEPLLHPKFKSFIQMIPANRPYILHINTNWSLVTKENMETLKCFDLVRISLDTSNASLWEKLCPGGPVLDLNGVPSIDRYNMIAEKIEYWLQLKDHAPTRLVCVVSSINEHDVEKHVDLWHPKLSPRDHIQTKTILSYGGVMRDSHMSRYPCIIPSCKYLTVAWNGDCTPCNLDVNIAHNVGNLYEEMDMMRIVHGKRWKQAISNIKRKQDICMNCLDANNRGEDREYWGVGSVQNNSEPCKPLKK